MVAQITDLPYLCVRNIFTYLPVIDIIYIDRVFPEWTSMQRDYLRKLTHLTLLLVDEDPMSWIQSNNLNFPFEDELVEGNRCKSHRKIKVTIDQIEIGHPNQLKLSQLMPSVECLEIAVICLQWSGVSRSFISLIESWADQLITFKFRYQLIPNPYAYLHEKYNWPISEEDETLYSLLECINTRLVKLQCLHFDFFGSFCLSEHCKGQADLPILQQLQEFRFHSDDASEMFEQLHRYATDRLRTIVIGAIDTWEDLLTEFGASPFAKSFALFLDYSPPNEFCASFLTTFDSLRSVKLCLNDDDETTLPQLTGYLSPLRNLVHLHLFINTDLSRFDSICDEHIHPLPVQVLTLSTGRNCPRWHNALRSRHWPRMFPACRILSFSPQQKCKVCEWYGKHRDELYPMRGTYKQCCTRLLAPFKSLPNLRKIYCDSFFGESGKDLQIIEQL